MRIRLAFESKVRDFQSGGKYNAIRLECGCRFYLKSGALSETKSVIIDTGALMTTLPYAFWNSLAYVRIGTDLVGGINPSKESRIEADIAQIGVILYDIEGNRSEPLVIKAFLLPKTFPNATPVLGFADLLEKFKVYFDFQNEFAFLSD